MEIKKIIANKLFIGITLLLILIAWNYWDKKENQEKAKRLDAQSEYLINNIETVLEKDWELFKSSGLDKPKDVNLFLGSKATTSLIEMRLDKLLKVVYLEVEISDFSLFITNKELVSGDIVDKYCMSFFRGPLTHAGFEWRINVKSQDGQDSYLITCPKVGA